MLYERHNKRDKTCLENERSSDGGRLNSAQFDFCPVNIIYVCVYAWLLSLVSFLFASEMGAGRKQVTSVNRHVFCLVKRISSLSSVP